MACDIGQPVPPRQHISLCHAGRGYTQGSLPHTFAYFIPIIEDFFSNPNHTT